MNLELGKVKKAAAVYTGEGKMNRYFLVLVNAGYDLWFPFRVRANKSAEAICKAVKYATEHKSINAVGTNCFEIHRDFDYEVCNIDD